MASFFMALLSQTALFFVGLREFRIKKSGHRKLASHLMVLFQRCCNVDFGIPAILLSSRLTSRSQVLGKNTRNSPLKSTAANPPKSSILFINSPNPALSPLSLG